MVRPGDAHPPPVRPATPAEGLSSLASSIAGILRRFATCPPDHLDAAIDDTLLRIGTLTGSDRSYLFLLDPPWPTDGRDPAVDEALTVSNTHEWCAPGVEPQIEHLQALPTDGMAWLLSRLRGGEHLAVSDATALPAAHHDLHHHLAPQGIVSLVAVPVLDAERLVGFLGFDSVRRARTWADEAIVLLHAVADVVCGGLDRRRAADDLHARERRFHALVEHSSDLTVVLSDDGSLQEISRAASRLLGWEHTHPGGRAYLDAVHPADAEVVAADLAAARRSPGEAISLPDHRLRHADGTWRWVLATVVDLRDDPTIAGMVLNGQDITSRKEAEAALHHQALHDPLTGLPNRALLFDRVQQALQRRQAGGGPAPTGPAPTGPTTGGRRAGAPHDRVGVVFLDLDHFKVINDSLGHTAGDRVLVEVARRLRSRARTTDTIGRFGGDEFVVLLEGVASVEEAHAVADRLLDAFVAPFTVGGREQFVTTSAGLVLSDGTTDAEALVRDADAAMYQAKEGGRGRLHRFDAPLRDQLLHRGELANDLRGSLGRGELSLDVQPLVALTDGRVLGVEALLRWDHPTRGRVSPAAFIPIAESTGTIVPIGTWVIGEALGQLRRWRDDRPGRDAAGTDPRRTDHAWRGHVGPDHVGPDHVGTDELAVSVNLSVHQLVEGDLARTVERELTRHGIEPHHLCLELTESALMAEPTVGRAVLKDLRAIGVRLAIDDFGTGYSSLAYLRDLPVTTLKIDRSFVTGLGRDTRDARVIAAIVGLAQDFGLTTIAEGVETIDQLDELRALGCDLVQGHLLARPVPAARFDTAVMARVADAYDASLTAIATAFATGPAGPITARSAVRRARAAAPAPLHAQLRRR